MVINFCAYMNDHWLKLDSRVGLTEVTRGQILWNGTWGERKRDLSTMCMLQARASGKDHVKRKERRKKERRDEVAECKLLKAFLSFLFPDSYHP